MNKFKVTQFVPTGANVENMYSQEDLNVSLALESNLQFDMNTDKTALIIGRTRADSKIAGSGGRMFVTLSNVKNVGDQKNVILEGTSINAYFSKNLESVINKSWDSMLPYSKENGTAAEYRLFKLLNISENDMEIVVSKLFQMKEITIHQMGDFLNYDYEKKFKMIPMMIPLEDDSRNFWNDFKCAKTLNSFSFILAQNEQKEWRLKAVNKVLAPIMIDGKESVKHYDDTEGSVYKQPITIEFLKAHKLIAEINSDFFKRLETPEKNDTVDISTMKFSELLAHAKIEGIDLTPKELKAVGGDVSKLRELFELKSDMANAPTGG
jgi:hypothetical protein